MPSFIYVATGGAAKTVVKASPSFGTVPEPSVKHEGILTLRRAPDHASFTKVHELPLGTAQWVEGHPYNGHVYAIWDEKLGAFRVARDGSLTLVSSVDTIGAAHHFTISADGSWVLTAGYMSKTVAVFPIASDGSLSPPVDSKLHEAPVNPRLVDRQEQCHPHQISIDPRAPRWALCCDLGADCVWVYSFNSQCGALTGAITSDLHLKMPEGSGPRHLDFHPTGKYVYVLCELDGRIVTCDWDGVTGQLAKRYSVSILPPEVKSCRADHSGGAAIRCSPDGTRVYASHRTDDTIVVFEVDDKFGSLTRLQAVHCNGVTPRDLRLDWPTEDDDSQRYLHVVNTDSQHVATFAVGKDGLLSASPVGVLETPGWCPGAISAPISPPVWAESALVWSERGVKRRLLPTGGYEG